MECGLASMRFVLHSPAKRERQACRQRRENCRYNKKEVRDRRKYSKKFAPQ
nr:MAG TPA: hypothetical protein [Caudoviricetes sp.]